MPPFRPPHFSRTPGLSRTFSGLNTERPPAPWTDTSLRLRTGVRLQPGLRRAWAARPPPRARAVAPLVLSPWLQKRLHSLAKISPITSAWAGRGVPQQQVPLRGAPPRRGQRALGGSGWDGAERARGAQAGRATVRLPVRRRRAESRPQSPLFGAP